MDTFNVAHSESHGEGRDVPLSKRGAVNGCLQVSLSPFEISYNGFLV